MKLESLNNSGFILQANISMQGDYERTFNIAQDMVDASDGTIDMKSSCNNGQWIHLECVSLSLAQLS